MLPGDTIDRLPSDDLEGVRTEEPISTRQIAAPEIVAVSVSSSSLLELLVVARRITCSSCKTSSADASCSDKKACGTASTRLVLEVVANCANRSESKSVGGTSSIGGFCADPGVVFTVRLSFSLDGVFFFFLAIIFFALVYL